MLAAKNRFDSVVWHAEGGKRNKNKAPSGRQPDGTLARYSNDYVSQWP